MSQGSAIEWTDTTWNPVRGCTKVSPGCANCYAETFAERWRGVPGHAYEQGFDLRLVPEKLDEPLRWKKPRRVFVNSMSDLFQDGVPDAFIDRVFAVMALAPQHTFQVLTKRAERMRAYMTTADRGDAILDEATDIAHDNIANTAYLQHAAETSIARWPLANVWLGVSVENQHFADERIPLLLQTPAAVRFISAEPLLGPLDLAEGGHGWLFVTDLHEGGRTHLDWVIVGGESGRGARPCDIEWARSIILQCRAANVPVFIKQLGASAYKTCPVCDGSSDPTCGRCAGCNRQTVFYSHPKGGEPSEWPEDLRVREFPMQQD